MLKLCNNRRANYLLNVAPDRAGLIPAHSLKRLKEVGELLGVKSPPTVDASNESRIKSNKPDAGDGK